MRRMTVLLVALMLGTGVVVVGVQAPTRAHDHLVPKAKLMKWERFLQRGQLQAYCWTRPSGSGNVATTCADYAASFPRTDRVKAGSRLKIRLLKDERPEGVVLEAYPRANRNGTTEGKRRILDVALKRVVENGRTVAWDAVFDVNRPDRHYYLLAGGVWEDEHGGGDQDAIWAFHVRTRPQ